MGATDMKGSPANVRNYQKIVEEYLKTGYGKEERPEEISVSGERYKILEKEEVTTFYDAEGKTLFDVGNGLLEKRYGELKSSSQDIRTSAVSAKQKAKQKLEKELEKSKDKAFAGPVIGYLLGRCAEDEGIAQDVIQRHKAWEKCFDYIYTQARKQAKGGCAAVRDNVVYEWAEDYYHKDDKAEEEKKAREAAERKKREEERKKKAAEQKKTEQDTRKKEKVEEKFAEPSKSKKNPKEMDGQMDLFSMMGI